MKINFGFTPLQYKSDIEDLITFFITKSGFFTTNRTKNVLLPARAVLPVSRAVSKTPVLDIIYIFEKPSGYVN